MDYLGELDQGKENKKYLLNKYFHEKVDYYILQI